MANASSQEKLWRGVVVANEMKEYNFSRGDALTTLGFGLENGKRRFL